MANASCKSSKGRPRGVKPAKTTPPVTAEVGYADVPPVMTIPQFCELWPMSRRKFYRLVKRGVIRPTTGVGNPRISREEFVRLLREGGQS